MYSSGSMPSSMHSCASSIIPFSYSVLFISSTFPSLFQVYEAACTLYFKYRSRISLSVSSEATSNFYSSLVRVFMRMIFLTCLVNLPIIYLSASFHQATSNLTTSLLVSLWELLGGIWRYLPVGQRYSFMLVSESIKVIGSCDSLLNQCVISWPELRTMGSHRELFQFS